MEQLDDLVSKSKNHSADVSKVLIEYVFHAIDNIMQVQLDKAQEMLSHCEEIVISATKQSILLDAEVLGLISHTNSLLSY
jgi:hypothetical protein